jgi:hypothetical protein
MSLNCLRAFSKTSLPSAPERAKDSVLISASRQQRLRVQIRALGQLSTALHGVTVHRPGSVEEEAEEG